VSHAHEVLSSKPTIRIIVIRRYSLSKVPIHFYYRPKAAMIGLAAQRKTQFLILYTI